MRSRTQHPKKKSLKLRDMRSRNFWRNLQTCLARIGLTEQHLVDAGIDRPSINRWRREGLMYLWGETSQILQKVLRIENANDLFAVDVPPLADTSSGRQVPVSPDVDAEMHDRLTVLMASPFRDAVCILITSLHSYFLRR